MRNMAVFEISGELLLSLLHIREDAEFESVWMDKREGLFYLKVSHHDLPASVLGVEATQCELAYMSITHECGHTTTALNLPEALR